jgi:P-type Mg2+ transporter
MADRIGGKVAWLSGLIDVARDFSLWLSMQPGTVLARRLMRPSREVHETTPSAGAYWNRDAAVLLDTLRSSAKGLTSQEAAQRLRRYGPNAIEDERRSEVPRLMLRQLESPLMLILVFAATISLFLRDWIEAAIILAIVLGSAVLGFIQEYRASAAVATLRRRLALTVRVMRDGIECSAPASEIVTGDVVVLSAGNLVPADGLLIEARDFLVSEASLTGESFPVEKRPGVVAEETPLARRTNCVFLGTSVRSGSAKVVIVETGRATAYGEIAATIAARPQETDFARGVRGFGQLLMRVMVLIVLFVMTANQLLGRPALESLLFAVALAVGLTPELLPAIVSVTLSRGAREMARRGVIVRRLETIEDLGSIDVLCTDKTGTLTAGVVELDAAVDCEGAPSTEVERLAFVNATLETGIANPLDAAIVAAGDSRGLERDTARKIDEIPYDFIRKRLTIVVEDGDPAAHLVITKGAFENVLAICTIEPALTERCRDYYRRMSAEGFRMLAVAVKRTSPKPQYGHGDEREMTLAGFLLFLDPPRTDVTETIRDLAALGISTKIVTGDNRYVAAHVAAAVGLDPNAMLTGEELAKIKDEALWSLAARTDLFVEIDPQQKERIVRALQRTGHAVGYLGDGINDAPALHAADAGISVESAVDVARESADVVLLERDLAVLHRGVVDGRATFANTLKYIAITTSANFGNMVSMALATPLLPFLPLAAKQILLNNFLSDVPSMAISTDRVDAARLESPQRWDLAAVRRFMIVFGLVSSAFDLLTFFVLLRIFDADERTFQTAWFVVSLLTELAVLLVLRTHGPAWRSVPSPLLLWTTLAVLVVALALPYSGAAAALFGFVPLSLPLMASALLIVGGYVLTTEAVKLGIYARKGK